MLPSLAIVFLLAEANPSALELPTLQLHGFVDVFYDLNTNRPADRTSFATESDATGNATFSKTQTLAIASAVTEF
jgi:hypothetical protein